MINGTLYCFGMRLLLLLLLLNDVVVWLRLGFNLMRLMRMMMMVMRLIRLAVRLNDMCLRHLMNRRRMQRTRQWHRLLVMMMMI